MDESTSSSTSSTLTPPLKRRKSGPKKVIPNEIRNLIIERLNDGQPPKDVSLLYDVKYETVRSIYKTYLKDGRVEKKKTGHRKSLLSDQQKEKICDWVDDDCHLTLEQLKRKCLEEFNISLSVSTVERALKEFHYTIKRVHRIPNRRNDSSVIQKRFDYAINYNRMMVEREKIFFLDETGIQIFSRASYGRSPRGVRATKRVAQLRTRNYSIASVMNQESLYFFEIQNKAYNSEDYSEFLNKFLQHLANDGISGAYLVMDNVRFHKTELITNLIQSHGHRAVFLPPYSPFLNPIENLFNQWKNFIKRGEPQNENQLYELVNNSSELITSIHCMNYYKHMESYLHKCLNKEEIEY
jgi:transposase